MQTTGFKSIYILFLQKGLYYVEGKNVIKHVIFNQCTYLKHTLKNTSQWFKLSKSKL